MKIDQKNMILTGMALIFIICGAMVAGADEINITLVSTFETDGQASDIELKGEYAYVADGENGLVVVDVNNPSSPVLAGRCDVNGSAADIAVEGNYAYVTGEINGLKIIDISNPSSPILVSTYDADGIESGIAVSDGYAYLANDKEGLTIVDVSNPSSPTLAGSFSQSDFNAYDVAVEGSCAYIASEFGLFVFDVSDPKSPILTGRTNPGNLMDEIYEGITVSGNRTYSIDCYNRLFINDISDPSSPFYAGSGVCGPAASTPPRNLGVGIVVQDNYAYASSLYFGIINISNPSSSSFVDYYDVGFNEGTGGPACGVAVSGDYAYVTNENGLVILLLESSNTGTDPNNGNYSSGTSDVVANSAEIDQNTSSVIEDTTKDSDESNQTDSNSASDDNITDSLNQVSQVVGDSSSGDSRSRKSVMTDANEEVSGVILSDTIAVDNNSNETNNSTPEEPQSPEDNVTGDPEVPKDPENAFSSWWVLGVLALSVGVLLGYMLNRRRS